MLFLKNLRIGLLPIYLLFVGLPPGLSQPIDNGSPALVHIEGGKFTMGCTEEQQGCLSDEEPALLKRIYSFWLGKYEVTNLQFAHFLSSAGNQMEGGSTWYQEDKYAQIIRRENGDYLPKPGMEQYPVANVSWFGAQAYTDWLTEQTQKNYRLPTEAEWEYAARGGKLSKGYRYSGSNALEEVAWYSDNAANSGTDWGFNEDNGSHPVGKKKPNELGLFDMSGNQKEWCQGAYSPDYRYSSQTSSYTILRGGSWDNNADEQRVSAREAAQFTSRFSVNKGFRVAMDIDLKPALDALAEERGFSGTLLVLKQGKKLYQNSFGLANRATGRVNADSSQYLIASITKLFTSVLILQLAEKGLLELNAPISEYLPDYPERVGKHINVQHLLTHTSGLKNSDTFKKEGSPVPAMYSDHGDIEQLIQQYCSSPTENRPGTNYDYNNADYLLLGKIIEKVTGKSYETVLQENILDVLHLDDTGLLSVTKQQPVAQGYQWDRKEQVYRKDAIIMYQNYFAAGAMYSTAADLGVFTRAVYDGTLIKEASVRKLKTTYPGTRGYGFGLWVRYPRYHESVVEVTQRYGRIWGVNTLISQFIERDISVVVLANTNRVSSGTFQELVGKLLFE